MNSKNTDVPVFDTSSDSLDKKIVEGLSKIAQAIKSQAWQESTSNGITPTQGQVINLIHSRAEAPMRLSEIAEALAIKPATASDAVTTLVEKGLVQKKKLKVMLERLQSL